MKKIRVTCPICGKERVVNKQYNQWKLNRRPCRICSNQSPKVLKKRRETQRAYKEMLAQKEMKMDYDSAIQELYLNQEYTLNETGWILGLSAVTIRNDLVALGCQTRPRGGNHAKKRSADSVSGNA